MSHPELERAIGRMFGLRSIRCEVLPVPVNDVVVVTAGADRFALKLYHSARTVPEVQWEVDLVRHLADRGAPVARPVAGRGRYVHTLTYAGARCVAVLYEWAPGAKPAPCHDTYVLLGTTAAKVHRAADSFCSSLRRERYDATMLIDEQLSRMRAHLSAAGRWHRAVRLAGRLKEAIADPELDWGVCHMDLTLDNVHVSGDRLTAFDFDSAGECWRAYEPYGVLRFSPAYFQAWLEGYRSVRAFAPREEVAVGAFTVIGDLRVIAWKLGVAVSSSGPPLLGAEDLPAIVNGWEALADEHL